MTRPTTGLPYLDEGLDQPGSVLAFAHRGGAAHPDLVGLENTLTAFEHAAALGYTYLETDVHATRDGRLLAFHDTVFDRVTSSVGSIASTPYADLAGVLVAGRERIPLLTDLLEHLPGCRFNVDLKSDAAVDALAELVDATGSHDRVCVGSFSERRLHRFRRRVRRRVATSFGPIGVGLARYAPAAVAARLVRRWPGDVLQVPHRTRGLQVTTRELVDRAHAAGRPVHVWTVDDPAEMEQLLDLGVDGLMTDRTDVLRAVLLRRGQWVGR